MFSWWRCTLDEYSLTRSHFHVEGLDGEFTSGGIAVMDDFGNLQRVIK